MQGHLLRYRLRENHHRRGEGLTSWVYLLLPMVVAGCAGTAPSEVARSYLEALQRGERQRAYDLTSQTFREAVGRSTFEELAGDGTIRRQARDLLDGPHGGDRVTLSQVRGQPLVLVREDGRWRVEHGLLPPVDQSSPDSALRSFKLALLCRRWDLVLELIPPEMRKGLTEARLAGLLQKEDRARTLLEGLKEFEDLPFQVMADRAIWRKGRREVVLQRIEDRWYISDPS